VRGWDPVADAGELLAGATICEAPLEAVTGADAAVIVTEWPQLAELDWAAVHERMRHPLLIDGRNFLDAAAMQGFGFVYEGIGRASAAFAGLPETPEREAETKTAY
jgi:UDPglucose 6-dehydrogenase